MVAKAQTEPPQFMTVDGRLYDSTTPEDPLLDNSVLMRIQVLNPAKTCILYEEEQTVSTLSSNGYFNVRVGSPTSGAESLKRTTNDSGNSMVSVFQNQSASITGRNSGGGACSYTPSAGDTRYFRYIVTPSTTGVTSTLSPDMQIDSVPQSLVAETLQGMSPDDFVQINSDVTQAKANALFGGSYTTLTGLLAGTSGLYLRNTTNGTVLPSRATDPLTPAAGQIWYDSDDNVLRYFDGTVVQTLSSGSADPTKLPLAGGTMAGAIDMATNDITDIGHMTQAPQRTFRFGVYTTAQQTSLIATPLVAGHEGTVWYNTTTNKLMFWDGTAEYAVSPVDSVFGRTGAVVAVAGDYTATQITNTAAGNIAATDVQAAINELDTEKVAKAGDSMGGALTMSAQNQVRFADAAGGESAAIQAPTTIGANYVLTLPDTAGSASQVLTTDGTGVLSWTSLAAVGETNTASNQGIGGVGLYDAKSGVDLQFRNINAASNKVSVALDAGNKEVDINVNEANFDSGVIPNTAAGNIAATNVQAAINELDTEKVATTRAINTAAGSGLSGGGDLSADRSLSVNINGTTAETTVAGADEILIYDASASALRKMTRTNFVLSESEVDAMVSNNGFLTSEADTLATVTGRGASTATNITMNTQAQTRYADAAGGEYAAIQAPATIGANYVLTLPTSAGSASQVLTTDGTGVLSWTSLAAVGETNTASNQGIGGVGLYDAKSGVDLQFRNINAASNKVSVALDAGNKEVDINVNEANLDSGVIPNTAGGNIAATNVQAAINEIDTEKVAKAGDTMTGRLNMGPSGVATTNGGSIAFTELAANGTAQVGFRAPDDVTAGVIWALPAADGSAGQVLQTSGAGVLSWIAIPSAPVTTVFGRSGAVVAMTSDYDANQVDNTPAGNIAATDVQAAINELDTEKVATTRAINTAAGSGLSGGGDLSADRSLSVNINGTTSETTVAGADEILIYDASASALRKMTRTNFVLSESEVDAMVSNNGYLTSEADTLATVTGRGASTATNITMNTQAQTRYADAAGGEYAAIQAPATISANYVLTLPDTAGSASQVLTTDGTGVLSWTTLAAVGETNTASNQGLGGVGLYDAKSGVDLQFRNINTASNKVSVALDAGNKEVDINVNEANFDSSVIPNTAAGNIAATNVQAAINELDTDKVAKTGDTMTGALNIDNEQELRLSEADGSGANYVAIKALTTLGANYTLTLPPDDGVSGQYLQTDGNGILTWVTPAGVGETNTASNQGAGGVGVFKQKTTYDLEFRNINAASNKISVALDAGNNEIDINVNEGNLDAGAIPNTAAGNIAATNVQAAINELDTEKVATTRAINTAAGSGLSGGGDLSADRSLSVNINGTTAETAVAGADEILIYDTSASALRKMTRTNFVLSEAEVDAMVSNNGYLTAEADTLATVTGRGASTATNITMSTQAQTRYADSAGGEYAAIQAPATIGANYVLTLPDTAGSASQVLTTDGTGVLSWTSLAAVGETNTASNQGVGGVGLYDAKSGVDLQFRNINAASNKVSVALDVGNKEVDINVNEANFDSAVIPNTAAGNIAATNVQAAINELDTEKVAKSGDTMTGRLNMGPSGVAATNGGSIAFTELAANGTAQVGFRAPDDVTTGVIWALPPADGSAGQVLQTSGAGVLSWIAIPSAPVSSVFGRTGAVVAATSDYDANQIDNTAAGNIAATDVQAAINELDTEKVATTRAINTAAGSGLTGGGDLSADRSLSVNINGTTAETAVAGADEILIYDTSASALRKMTRTNFVLSESEVDAFVANNGYLTAESDTLASVTGRGASTATNITMNTQAQTRYADAAGGEYAAIQAPATIGANYVLTLPDTAGSASQVLTTDGSGVLSWTTPSTTPGADSLDFTHFADAMTLDASTDIAATGTNALSITNSGTGDSFRVNDQAADTTPFVIDNAGNVGIGTTTALSKVSIYGAPYTDGDIEGVMDIYSDTAMGTNAGGGLLFGGRYTAGGTYSVFSGIRGRKENATSGNTAGALTLATKPAGGSLVERVRIDSAGNVGVGTTVPGSLLDVAGTITSRPHGTVSGETGKLSLRELAASGTNTATIRSPDTLAGDYVLTLPVNDGDAGQYLQTDGNGVLSWVTPAGVGETNTASNQGVGGVGVFDAKATFDLQFRNINAASNKISVALDAGNKEIDINVNEANLSTAAIPNTAAGTISATNTQAAINELDTEKVATTRSINTAAGSGLTGGGDLSADRSLSVDINGTTAETAVAGADEILIYDASATALRKMTRTNFVLSEAEVDAMVSNNGFLSSEADTLATVTGRGAGTSTDIVMSAQADVRFADSDSSNYIALQSPATVGSNYTLTLPTTAGAANQVLTTDGAGVLTWTTPATGVTADSLNFTDFVDAMTLDASTDIAASGTNVLSITNTGTGNSFVVNDAAGDTSPFVIDDSGNVGIGTTTLYYKLNVNGYMTAWALDARVDSPVAYSPTDILGDGGSVTIQNLSNTNTAGGKLSFDLRNSSGNSQWAGITGFSTSGAGSYTPEIAIQQQTGAATYAERIRIDANGSVGIGTITPATLLDVAGAITARPHGTATGETGKLIMRELAAGGTETATIRAPDAITTSYSLTLPTTAGAASQVLTTDGTGVLSWTTPSGGVAADSLNFTDFADTMTLDASTDIAASGTNVLSITNSGTGNSFVVNDAAGDTSPFVIDSAGFVGIGTTTPTEILNVVGESLFERRETNHANQAAVTIKRSRSDATAPAAGFGGSLNFRLEGFTNNSEVQAGDVSVLWENTQTNDTTDRDSAMLLYTTIDNTLTERVRITSAGSVGIGTTTPGTLLDVAGSVTSRPSGTGTGQTGQLIMRELAAGGTETATIRAPDAITTSYALTLPTTAGTSGQVLRTDGSGGLSWINADASITADSLDFTSFADSMALDASTDIAVDNAEVLSITNTGTGNSFVVNDDTGDTSPFVVDASGNVGIGTTAPAYQFHVYSSGVMDPIFQSTGNVSNISVSGTQARVKLHDLDAAADEKMYRVTSTAGQFTISAQNDLDNTGTAAFTIDRTGTTVDSVTFPVGNVGIGTTNPLNKLDIRSSNESTTVNIRNNDSSTSQYPGVVATNYMGTPNSGAPTLTLRNYRGNSTTSAAVQSSDLLGRIMFYGGYDTSSSSFEAARIQANAEENFSGTAAGANLRFLTANTGTTTATEKMRLSANGSLGIGTTTPTIAAAGTVLHLHDATASEQSLMHFTNATTGATSTDGSYIGVDSTDKLVIAQGENSDIQFWTFGSERFRVTGAGSIGIGTTVPGTLLDVAGAITSRPSGTGTGQTGQIIMRELASGGTNTFAIRAPDALSADRNWTLPDSNGSSGQVLQTNGSGVLSWVTVGGGGSLDSLSDAMTDATAESIYIGSGAGTGAASTYQYNLALGYSALSSMNNASADRNTAIGWSALSSLNSGANNTALGSEALQAVDSGGSNVGVGREAMGRLTSGSNNTSVGTTTLFEITSHSDNTALGAGAGVFLDGNSNVMIGRLAMESGGAYAGDADNNIAVGTLSLAGITSGDNNVSIGKESFLSVTTASNNIGVGNYSGGTLTTGNNNILIGYGIDVASAGTSNFMSLGNIIFATGVDGTGTTVSSGKVGVGMTAPTARLTIGDAAAVDGGIIASGYGTVGTDGDVLSVTGAGRRMMWYPRKGAFRAGGVDSDQWDDANIGNYSVAMGNNAKALGNYGIALGNASAEGISSVAIGNWVSVFGLDAAAIGNNIISYGNYNASFGNQLSNQASSGGLALGTGVQVGSGFGYNNDGNYSVAIGAGNPAGARPMVTGDSSVGIFMGDQSGLDLSADNTMAIIGGNVGIGSLSPTTKLVVDGGVTISPATTINLTADNQLVTVGNESYLRLSSNNATSTNRTFCLTAGATGQVLVIELIAQTAELIDGAQGCAGSPAAVNLSATWTAGADDTIQLIYNGSKWLQISTANN